MNNQKQNINYFLKQMVYLIKENPEIINNKMDFKYLTYYYLTRINIASNETLFDGNKVLEKIEDFFSNDKLNIRKNKNSLNIKNKTCPVSEDNIKMYLPFDAYHMEDAIKDIVKYLYNNDINFDLSIGNKIRNNGVIVKLFDKKDALSLESYINHNTMIMEGLINPNPFTYVHNNISYVISNVVSYNEVMASLTNLYLIKNKDNLGEISVNEFISFVSNYYKKALLNPKNSDIIFNDLVTSDYTEDDNALIKVNVKNIISLFIDALSKNYSQDDYFKHYEKCNDVIYVKEQMGLYLNNDDLFIMFDLLNKAYDVMSLKYGENTALENINMYLETGKVSYITREYDLRDKIYNSSFRSMLNNYLKENNVSLKDIIGKSNDLKDVNEIINYMFEIMNKYYNSNDTIEHIIGYIKTGNPTYLTRKDNLRENIKNSDLLIKIKDVLIKEGLSPQEYVLRLDLANGKSR